MDAGSDIPARARRCRRIPACAMSALSSRLRRALAFAAGRRSAPDKSELGPARRKAIDLGTPSFRRVGVVAPRSVFRAFGGAIKARLDWADIVPRWPAAWPARPPGPRARPARAPAPPAPAGGPPGPRIHATHPSMLHTTRLNLVPARRRALRAARRDVSGRRGHPLSRTGAARSRGGLAAARHPRRSFGRCAATALLSASRRPPVRSWADAVPGSPRVGRRWRSATRSAASAGDADSRRKPRARERGTRTKCCRRPQ